MEYSIVHLCSTIEFVSYKPVILAGVIPTIASSFKDQHTMIHILLIASLLLTQSLAHNSTQHQNETAVIFKDSKVYEYYGCYNETTQIQDSAQIRALDGGNSLIKKGDMTVPMCLEYCSNADGVKYTYAGLEWSRYARPECITG